MLMDDKLLENDLDWFLLSNHDFIAHFATAGKGPLPEKIKQSIDDYEEIYRYFVSLKYSSEVTIIECNLPIFTNELQRLRYLSSFVDMSRKGLFSYDYIDDKYMLISRPVNPLTYQQLSNNVKNIIYKSQLNISSCIRWNNSEF